MPDVDVNMMRAANEVTAASRGSMFGRVFAALSAPAPEGVKSPGNGLPGAGADAVVRVDVGAPASSFPAHPDAGKTQTNTKHVSPANWTIVFSAAAITLTKVPAALRSCQIDFPKRPGRLPRGPTVRTGPCAGGTSALSFRGWASLASVSLDRSLRDRIPKGPMSLILTLSRQ